MACGTVHRFAAADELGLVLIRLLGGRAEITPLYYECSRKYTVPLNKFGDEEFEKRCAAARVFPERKDVVFRHQDALTGVPFRKDGR